MDSWFTEYLEEVNEKRKIYNCLKVMDMILYKHAYEPETVKGFESISDMAKYYREFLHVILPEEYQYQNDTMAEW